ncbi:MAG: hypothetical protein ABT10_03245 [Novosphingobium sp. SCN 63-17]|nr:hypothetical protein [Novosphingobium sp. 1748]ODU84404.1 MAG: hypothetical protein ABT10_03245 [Novosphingobium sp. SCN 63-17]
MPVAALAFFLAFGDLEEGPQRWCAYRTSAEMKKAVGSGETSGQWAEMRWQGGAVTRLFYATEREDYYVEDTYSLDTTGRTVALARHGHYINDPFWTAVYRSDAKGKLMLTQPSAAEKKKRETAGREDSFLDWPKYVNLSSMPFEGLVARRNGAVVVRYGCIKASR